MGFADVGEKNCSGNAILAIKHEKEHCFFIAENACDALNIENVPYSDSMKIMENKNVLRTRTGSIFTHTHTQNSSGFTTHSLVNVSGTFIRQPSGS